MKPSDWISVTDQPPPFNKLIKVRILNKWEDEGMRVYKDIRWGLKDIVESGKGWYGIEKITHWMPIVPPEEKNERRT